MGDDTCSIDGCERPRWARGWCTNHYQLWRRNGAPERVKGRPQPCSITGCDRTASTRGWCGTHYQRWITTGDPGQAAIRNARLLVADGRKLCGRCGDNKLLAEFNAHPNCSGGVMSFCRVCCAAAKREWKAKNPGSLKKWRDKNPDLAREANNRRRALRAGVESERIVPSEVFKRDDFTCQLCMKPLDMDAPRWHPLGPTIDHVIPLSRRGPHTYANVQAAHFGCNSSKGDREAPLLGLLDLDPDPG